MARPKKESTPVSAPAPAPAASAEIVLGHAVGIIKKPTGEYVVVAYECNESTGTAVEFVPAGRNLKYAFSDFKTLAYKYGLV